jgi:hypothetical protein
MLGNKIGEEHGKVTGQRVLPGDEKMSFVKMEMSIETQATIYGIQGVNMGTFTAYERGPGQMYAEGQGIIMTADGDGAIWNGHGVGTMDEQGTMHLAASVAVQTTSEKLAALNNLLVLVEVHQTMAGEINSTLYEWKGQ